MEIDKADFLICGAGIIGLTIAKRLLEVGYENIIIIEKEEEIGIHASGRNSGVLHAGIYYTPDSLRAKSCHRGNLLMKQFCREKGLPINETGKVIVATDENEINLIKELYNRAITNGAKVELIDEKQLEEVEPNAKTCKIALYSYDTAVVEPNAILKSLYNELALSKRVKIMTGVEFKDLKSSNTIFTTKGEIKFNTFINSAGAYSDKVAHAFGIALNYKLIPFKGIYKKLDDKKASLVNGNIYPVPNLKNPFLGIHFTKNVNGEVYVGPTAIPAFGRENYGILKGINKEAIDFLLREMILFSVDPKFRGIALTESKKYIPKFFFEDAQKLVKRLNPTNLLLSEKVGIRPQLVDWKKKELVMDFMVCRDGDSIHILNAISPAFTSSMDFADFIIREYIKN